MDDAMVVALFRHGITEENKRHAYIGWTDAPLCEEAFELLARRKFESSPYEWLVTSDLQRCVQTASIMFPGKKMCMMPDFREMHFGIWEGKTYAELAGDPSYEHWLNTMFKTEIPGGESSSLFDARIEAGWQKVFRMMLEREMNSMAIVTHDGVMRYLLSKLAPEKRYFWDWKIPHGNGFELLWSSKEAFRRGERCSLLQAVPLTENQAG